MNLSVAGKINSAEMTISGTVARIRFRIAADIVG